MSDDSIEPSTSQAQFDPDYSSSEESVIESCSKNGNIKKRRKRFVNPHATSDSAKRNTSSKLFCFTLAKIPVNLITKQEIEEMLTLHTDEIVIGKRNDINDQDIFDVYYRVKRDISFDESSLIESLDKILPNVNYSMCHLHVRKAQDAISYCTRHDSEPSSKRVNNKFFNKAYHVVNYCKNKKKLDLADMEYISHPYKTQIKESYAAINAKFTKLIPLQPLILFKPFGNWIDELIEWLNDWIINGWSPKKKQLLIWGEPDAGKTEILRAIFGVLMHQCFSPLLACPRFAWSGWDPLKKNFVIVDEMNFANFMLETWKSAVSGHIFYTEYKSKNGSHPLCIRCPMIFCSNLSLDHYAKTLDPVEIDAIKSRLKIIHASADARVNIQDVNDHWRIDEEFDSFPLLDVHEDKFPIGVTKFKMPKNFEQIEERKKVSKEKRKLTECDDFDVPATPLSIGSGSNEKEQREFVEKSCQYEAQIIEKGEPKISSSIGIQVDESELKKFAEQKK